MALKSPKHGEHRAAHLKQQPDASASTCTPPFTDRDRFPPTHTHTHSNLPIFTETFQLTSPTASVTPCRRGRPHPGSPSASQEPRGRATLRPRRGAGRPGRRPPPSSPAPRGRDRARQLPRGTGRPQGDFHGGQGRRGGGRSRLSPSAFRCRLSPVSSRSQEQLPLRNPFPASSSSSQPPSHGAAPVSGASGARAAGPTPARGAAGRGALRAAGSPGFSSQ